MKIHTLVASTYLTLAILVFSSITHSLAQNTTSCAVKSAAPQVATQLSDGQIEVSSATVTYSPPHLATIFSSGQVNVSNGAVSPLYALTSALITTSNQVQTFSTVTTEGLSLSSSSGEMQTHRPPL